MPDTRAVLTARTRFPSPLRYPGGKGKISNYLKLLLLRNGLVGSEYCELYAGGAAVALSLLFEEYVSAIHINDIDRGVHSFWFAVLEATDDICRLIQDERVDMRQWARQRAVQQDPDARPLDLAFSTFFLNRTNRSGIISGGVIGGQRQHGRWKLDARYNKSELIYRIQKIARYRSRITLTDHDAAQYLATRAPFLPRHALLYLDPPYFVKGAGLYTNFYEPEDHREIAVLIGASKTPWVVSYDHVPEIIDMYAEHTRITYGLSYSAADRYRGGEVMFFSPDLAPPAVESPANLHATVLDKALRGVQQCGPRSWQ